MDEIQQLKDPGDSSEIAIKIAMGAVLRHRSNQESEKNI